MFKMGLNLTSEVNRMRIDLQSPIDLRKIYILNHGEYDYLGHRRRQWTTLTYNY